MPAHPLVFLLNIWYTGGVSPFPGELGGYIEQNGASPHFEAMRPATSTDEGVMNGGMPSALAPAASRR
jgi:hypothetical protein